MSYCQGFGIADPEEIAELLLYVQAMDQAFRDFQTKKMAEPKSMSELRKAAGVSR